MKKASTKGVIILLGPPGSGKGTQGELLSEKLNLYYFETSKVLEESFKRGEVDGKSCLEVEGEKYYFAKEKQLWEQGILCSPPFVTHLVFEKIKKLFAGGKNLIISGSPRSLYEGQHLVPLLKEMYGSENIKVILIEQTEGDSIFRNTHRRICRLMRHPILYSEETANLTRCPLDGSQLVRREGLDDPETIKVRLGEFKERTFPLIEYFEKEGLEIKRVNGSPPPAEVFENILKALE